MYLIFITMRRQRRSTFFKSLLQKVKDKRFASIKCFVHRENEHGENQR